MAFNKVETISWISLGPVNSSLPTEGKCVRGRGDPKRRNPAAPLGKTSVQWTLHSTRFNGQIKWTNLFLGLGNVACLCARARADADGWLCCNRMHSAEHLAEHNVICFSRWNVIRFYFVAASGSISKNTYGIRIFQFHQWSVDLNSWIKSVQSVARRGYKNILFV